MTGRSRAWPHRHRATALARARHLLDIPPAAAPTMVTLRDHRDRFEALTAVSVRGRRDRLNPLRQRGWTLPIEPLLDVQRRRLA